MKRLNLLIQQSAKDYNLLPFLFLLLGLIIGSFVFAQTPDTGQAAATADTATAAPAEEPAAEEESAMISPSVEFLATQKNDNTIDLKAALKAKIKGQVNLLHSLKVSFFIVTDSGETEIGKAVTDRSGKALFNYKADPALADKEGKYHFKASVAGNKNMEAAEEELYVKRALLSITPVKEDSLLTVQVKLMDISAATETPVPEATIGIYVKRLFGVMKVGEGTTDENGELSVEIPAGIPGDNKGNLTLLAKLDESELYGNLEAAAVQAWGKPVSNKMEDQPRALWSSHPPLWMLITFAVLMVAVWGHYIVIVFELFRLRKEQPETALTTDATN